MMNAHRILPRRHLLRSLAGIALASTVLASTAQPGAGGQPITWLVGQPPGGTVDVLTRLVARQVEKTLGQTVVVDNRPGAAGAIALQAAARAPKNGLTLVTVPGPILTAVPTPQIGKELSGVAMLGKGPMVVVGTMASPMPASLDALIANAKKDPKGFAFASSGNGTSQHLAGELINQMAGTQLVHIPYKGGSQAVTDVVGGASSFGHSWHHCRVAPHQIRQVAGVRRHDRHALDHAARHANARRSRPEGL